MTEEESYDLDMHLTTRWGMRILMPIAIGIILIVMGANTLPIGAIAIVIGILVIIYGLQRHIGTTSDARAFFGVGATLLSLLIGALAIYRLKSLPFLLTYELSGSALVQAAVKSITNSLVNYYLGVTSAACQFVFRNPLMYPFVVATATLAVSALVMGFMRK